MKRWDHKEALIACVEQLKADKERMKGFFSEQLAQQMRVLNENFEDFFQDEKLFFKHLSGLQNKGDYLLDALGQLKSSMQVAPVRRLSAPENTSEAKVVNEDDLTIEQKVRILEGKVDFVIRNMGDEANLNLVNDELFFVMSFRNMLQQFRTVSLLVDKFGDSERKDEFEDYSKTVHEFETAIFQQMKSKVFQINRRLQEMNDLLNKRIE